MMTRRVAVAVAACGIALGGAGAWAQERAVNTGLGAAAGAIVAGPVGAVAGGAIGYGAGHRISRGLGLGRRTARRHRRGHTASRRVAR